ncbi:MAG: hypothetical protein ACK5V3_14190 [Bdellovibrionales bacterium]
MDKIVFLAITLGLLGCQNTPCRDLRTQKSEIKNEVSPVQGGALNENSQAGLLKVKVYKPDGSLQCNMGKKISLQDMKKQLTGITVHSQSTLNDGLMRIQVCGAPTGDSHVFEISDSDLQKALKLGFKQWTSN